MMIRGFIRSGAWSALDQVLISGTNFLTTILIARSVSPKVFGVFVLIYTGLLLANRLQFLLVTQPHNILGAARNGRDYRTYTAATAVGQLGVAGASATLLLAIGLIPAVQEAGLPGVFFAAAFAIFAWQLQEFLRRVLYTEFRLRAAFLNDVVSYGGQIAVVGALWRIGHLTPVTAFCALAGTSAAAAILGTWQLRRSFSRYFSLSLLSENWRFAKWLLGGAVAFWATSQLYVYVVAVELGLIAAAILRAAQTLMGPLSLLSAVEDSFLPLAFAKAYLSDGDAGLKLLVRNALVVSVPIASAYCLFVAIFAGPILRVFYGSQYDTSARVLALFAAYSFLLPPGTIVTAALRAKRETQPIFKGQIYGSIGTLLGIAVLLGPLGVEGAVLGLILGASVANAVQWRSLIWPANRPVLAAVERHAAQN